MRLLMLTDFFTKNRLPVNAERIAFLKPIWVAAEDGGTEIHFSARDADLVKVVETISEIAAALSA